MALISCPECGREVSDIAFACPGCGYPVRQGKVTFVFDASSWKSDCYVYDMAGNELAACHNGDTVSFPTKPRTLRVKMSAGMEQPTVIVTPGKSYKVWINGMGQVRVKKID